MSNLADVMDALAWQQGLKSPALQSVNILRKTKEWHRQNLCWIDQSVMGRD